MHRAYVQGLFPVCSVDELDDRDSFVEVIVELKRRIQLDLSISLADELRILLHLRNLQNLRIVG